MAIGVATAGCSAGGDTEGGAAPTFRRAAGDSLAFEEPLSTTSDLVPPAAEGEPWTIVGSLLDPGDGAAVAAVWTSEGAIDGSGPGRRPHRGGVGESMAAAVPTDDGLLAVGRVGDGEASDAAVWRLDGDTWVQSRPEAMGGDHEQWAFDVATGTGGVIVAGGENAWGEVRARLWFSADGETWESVDGGPGGPLDTTGEESVRDVASYGDGFVAVGSRRVDNDRRASCGGPPTAGPGSSSTPPAWGARGARRSRRWSTRAPAWWPAATPTAAARRPWRSPGPRPTPARGPAAPAGRCPSPRTPARTSRT